MGGRGASFYAGRLAEKLLGNSSFNSSPIVISTIRDKTLQGIENRIRKLKHEEAFIFDSTDKLKDGVSGGNSSVSPPKEWDNIVGATVTHGHPIGNSDYGGTLSMADVRRMTNTQWKELRAAANGQGEYNYIMRRTAKADNIGLKFRVLKDTRKLEVDVKETYKEEYNKGIRQGKSKKQAKHLAAQKATGIVHVYWKKTLPQYGFEYVTPKKEYRYGR